MKRREFLGILGVSPMMALLRKIPNKDPEGEKIFEIMEGSDTEIRYYGSDVGHEEISIHDVVCIDEKGRLRKYSIQDPPYHPNRRYVVGWVHSKEIRLEGTSYGISLDYDQSNVWIK